MLNPFPRACLLVISCLNLEITRLREDKPVNGFSSLMVRWSIGLRRGFCIEGNLSLSRFVLLGEFEWN